MDSTSKKADKGTFFRPKKLKSALEYVNKQMYLRNLELTLTNRTLSLLQSIDKLVLESDESTQKICTQISHMISETASYPFVAILSRRFGSSDTQPLKVFGWNSRVPFDKAALELIEEIEIPVNGGWINSDATTQHVTISELLLKKEYTKNKINLEALDYASTIGVKSVSISKLTARGHLVGLMVIGLVTENIETGLAKNDKDLIERLGDAVGVALESKLLLEENERVLKQIQKANEKLKEMDETKDEFISMASHQLRTPLTSVKGYLSMVLDGDAGKISTNQRQLLNQAFVSSQRMVYLIADLLNVSRLKTGKFIIDSTPTNLAEMVESEISQLKEVAKSKKLALEFDKPDDVPLLMLDETKTRQVIMNFVDNAIYYTPSGGHIKIELQADRANVYFMVKDDGMGVPKQDQSHLFTKFYRAKNAQKARPDGTGLGLFMAKRVITDQGGTILFESAEGKGSTFGFKFDKPKTPVKPLPGK